AQRRWIVSVCFQAEDGIRDWSVTGVQTCALPICAVARTARLRAHGDLGDLARAAGRESRDEAGGAARAEHALHDLAPARAERARSEERRVGKECRARGARCR